MGSQSSRGDFSQPHSSKSGKRLILSVDDELVILFTRQQILEGAGYDVLSASDGERALRLFGSQPVDLVLLDYLMPGIDGGMVAQEMKARKPNVLAGVVYAMPVLNIHSNLNPTRNILLP